MVDYARESSIELYNMLYEFDDIFERDYAALEDVGGETSDASSSSSTETKSDSSNTTAASSNNTTENKTETTNNATTTDATKKEESKSNNADLKSTSGFVAKLKELVDKLIAKIKELIANLADKIDKLQQEGIDKFLKKISDAKTKNGLKEIEVENYKYDTQVFTDAITNIENVAKEYNNAIDKIFSAYEGQSNGTEESDNDSRTNVIANFNEKYGGGKIYETIATKLGYATTGEADAKSIKTDFQNKFRGEKEKMTINQDYANACESYLRNAVADARKLVTASNTTKDTVKKIRDKVKAVTAKPGTSAEVNNSVSKFVTDASKFMVFASSFYVFAFKLAFEYRTNCKIVLMRAYGLKDSDTKTDNKNAKTTETKTEEKKESSEENTDEES
jgi:hypothetical protein